MVAAACATCAPASSSAAATASPLPWAGTGTGPRTPAAGRARCSARRASTTAPTVAATPATASGYVQEVIRGLVTAPRATTATRPAPPSSARRSGQPYESDTQAAITRTPASTNVCRYGLPFGVAKTCHTRCVGPHCNDTATTAASSVHARRSRLGAARFRSSVAASSSAPVPRKTAGVKKLYVAGSARANTSVQPAGSNSRFQPGYAWADPRKTTASTGAARPVPRRVVRAARSSTRSRSRTGAAASAVSSRSSRTSPAPSVAMYAV